MKIGFAATALLMLSGSHCLVHAGEVMKRPMTWAHYTPWHTPLNTSLSAKAYYNYPLFHSTGDNRMDWAGEYRLAEAQGINGFFVDVVFQRNGGRTAYGDTVAEMLKAAEGSDFEVGLCLDVRTSVEQQVREVARMLDQVAGHPNYPKYNGRPVVATYTWSQWTPEEWGKIREELKGVGHDIYLIANAGRGYTKLTREWLQSYAAHFDMVYSFALDGLSGTPRADTVGLMADVANESGKDYMAGFWPGYYGAWLNGRNDFYQPHRGFDQLHDCFLLLRGNRDGWLHFTTWNDHDETSVLPMLFTTANPLITKAYIESFRGVAPTATQPEICLAYHREEIPGTLLRIEAMNLPSLVATDIEVSGRLLDRNGNEVARLDARSFSASNFDRTEWLVPTAPLASTSVLTPEVTVRAENYERTSRLPPVLLVNGWHQNAVTVKVPASEYIDFPNTLSVISSAAGLLDVSTTFEPGEEIASAALFRNDRPLADLGMHTEEGRSLLNLYLDGAVDWTLNLEGGEILDAARKFSEKSSPDFVWSASEASSLRTLAWTPVGLLCAVSPETKLTLQLKGGDTLTLSAGELNDLRTVRRGALKIEVSAVDTTLQNHATLCVGAGSRSLSVMTHAPQPTDMFYVRYVTKSGHVALSDIVYPFAGKGGRIPVNLVQTSVNLETSSGGTGMPGQNEYLGTDVPFRTPSIVEASIPPESIRSSRWDFNGTGRDLTGDNSVWIDQTMFIATDDSGNMALNFDGQKTLRMPLRTWPIGNATVDFRLKPSSTGKTPGPQSIIGRKGWSDGISINLLPDGRLEVVRDGSETVPSELVHSKTALPFDEWSHLTVTNDSRCLRIYINGILDAEKVIKPARSYGNSTWYVGGGFAGYANYRGQIDDLTVSGAAYAPQASEITLQQ